MVVMVALIIARIVVIMVMSAGFPEALHVVNERLLLGDDGSHYGADRSP